MDPPHPTAEEIQSFIRQTFSRDGIACGPIGRNCVDVTIPKTFTNHTFFCRKLEEEFGAIVHRSALSPDAYTVTLPEQLTVDDTKPKPTTTSTMSTTTVVILVVVAIVAVVAAVGMASRTHWPVDSPPTPDL